MDKKTLEYMQERVDKGNKILEEIEKLKLTIEVAKTSEIITMRNYKTDKNFKLEKFKSNNLNFDVHAGAVLANAYIDIAQAEIKRLEEEFARL